MNFRFRRRIVVHGWRSPRGAEATLARCLGVTQQPVSDRRLSLLLEEIKEVP